MDEQDLRLSRIDTLWSVVRGAHGPSGGAMRQAQEALLSRYGGAVRRYLLGALRDVDAADEVFQEFALKLVSGAFQRADAGQGRFRNFLKTALFHLIVDHQRRKRRQGAERVLVVDPPERVTPADATADEEEAWTRSWRDELLAKSWAALSQIEQSSGTPYYTVLRFRCDHPDMRSPDMALELSRTLNKSMQASAVRVLIHRARDMFAERLLDLVRDSLANPLPDELEEELIDLHLLDYCREQFHRSPAVEACHTPFAGTEHQEEADRRRAPSGTGGDAV